VHAFRLLGADEPRHILARQWPQLGLINPEGDFTDAEAIAAIIRITGGNFRLLHRLCREIQRILQINELQTVTKEVVETARNARDWAGDLTPARAANCQGVQSVPPIRHIILKNPRHLILKLTSMSPTSYSRSTGTDTPAAGCCWLGRSTLV
jgi:hypothetical protein